MTDEATIDFDIQLVGARDLIAELRALKENVAVRVSKIACKKVADFIQIRLRANAPNFTGKLRFNLFVRSNYARKRGVVKATVAVRTVGKADNQRNAFYWRFVEFGHKTRPRQRLVAGTDSKGRKRTRAITTNAQRKLPGQNFVRNTLAQVQHTASAIFFKEIETALSRASRKTANLRA